MAATSFVKNGIVFLIDALTIPLTPFVALFSKIQSRIGPKRLPISYKIWDFFGVMPLSYHYYQPVFNASELSEKTWTEEDPLYGIDLNTEQQLTLLGKLQYNDELTQFPIQKKSENSLDFYYDNWMFCSGDAEILYSLIRHYKPKRLIEIGSGFSTRIAKQAIVRNQQEGYRTEHTCVEPYEAPWLEKLGVDRVIRERVETLPIDFFETLEANDILFIDSSHVLRTRGDVFYEYLQILPKLKSGVIVHIHDIFIPFEYPKSWLTQERWFWTEQYLLQAFLVHNSAFEVLLGLNYLAHHHRDALNRCCPVFEQQKDRVASSFWIRRK
ncbi:class I SAM-dependent methyltransferase [Kamptonema cortianum]|uniref:Class I SAM-dependent methyltransferase n=1 Tax=Geitlerinema calcuttense NRMC-F 0142 TaxID=2922238 RepID=A0ABT7LZG7_9CYAN|nr:class I SAM-dependent methyltransferase [Geitlerinema calcuttense]MDK3155435.1 class I SAM-dependent methyltransferase [Kamptonema cortianum]MDL5056775.1 class I SAM-dependent methyltransferase [Geitlerinema calcuttense NRMC-F 0142]